MKTAMKKLGRFTQMRRLTLMALSAALVVLFAGGCAVGAVTPEGNWSDPVYDGEQYIYFAGGEGFLARVDTETRIADNTWRYPGVDGLGSIYGTPIIDDGVIYAVGYRRSGSDIVSELVAVNIENSQPVWVGVQLNTNVLAGLAVTDDTILVGTGTFEDSLAAGHLVTYDRATGRELGRLELADELWGGITVVDNSVAYFGTLGGTLYAVDVTGNAPEMLWTFDVGAPIAGQPLVEGDRLYIGALSDDNSIYGLDIEDRAAGRELTSNEWTLDAGGWVWADPVILDGVLYIATLEGELYALQPNDGQTIWSTPADIESAITAPPALVPQANDGPPLLAVSAYNQDIFLVATDSGSVSGRAFSTTNGVSSSPLVEDGFLYTGTLGGQILIFNTFSLALEACFEYDLGRCSN